MKTRYRKCRHNGKRMTLHVAVYLDIHGLDRLPDGYVVHHMDFNPFNNAVENLMCITKREHDRLHASRKRRNAKGMFV